MTRRHPDKRPQNDLKSLVHALDTGAMNAVELACCAVDRAELWDLAWRSDPVGRVSALALRWREAADQAHQRSCETYVLELMGEDGSDFRSLVTGCFAGYGMSPQEVILALNRLITRRAITLQSGLFYTRA